MTVAVIGTGYVGLVTGVCFAEMGNQVWCVDVDEEKIARLKRGEIPIFEPGLREMASHSRERGDLRFTTDIREALARCEVCFIAVGTPMSEDGAADLRYVMSAAESIGTHMVRPLVVVDKSTVPVGTAQKVRDAIRRKLDERGADLAFEVVSNPEFLKEGSAVADCMKPDRIVLGSESAEALETMRALYKPFSMNNEKLIVMDTASAEMTKYAANAMLAARVSFMNEIANICERAGADVNAVRRGVGSDRRIGTAFLYAGCGYGGSCFPKDVQALIHTASEVGYDAGLLRSIEAVNGRQKLLLVNKVKARFGADLTGRRFAVWGLSFKPDTDDMRESPAITIVNSLTEAGARVQAFDPKAMDAARRIYLKDNAAVVYCESKYEALKGADALLLVTEWKEFRSPDFEEIRNLLRTPLIIDGRNQYDAPRLAKAGLMYEPIGDGRLKRAARDE